ncbi:MAG: Crp/Fnr family transcriptional regulator [Burkholderiaceae bacterium]
MNRRTDRATTGLSGRGPTAGELNAIPWLEALSDAERAWVTTSLRIVVADPGAFVCKMGDRPTCWIGVIEGLVKMSGYAESGRTVTFAGFPPGGWFGEGTILKQECYQYYIEVLQKSVLAYLPVEIFGRLLEESIGFNRFLMHQFNQRLGQFIAYKAAERTSTREERLAAALATLFDPDLYPNAASMLRISQQELAYLAGTTRQQVNESLQILRDAGAVQAEYGGVRLLDFERLRDFQSMSRLPEKPGRPGA